MPDLPSDDAIGNAFVILQDNLDDESNYHPPIDLLHDAIEALQDRVKVLKQWVDDLQTGMSINCVYCGHNYGPDDKVPASMADVLKEHVEQCPEHPMSALKAEKETLRGVIENGAKAWMALQNDHPIVWEGDLGDAMVAACAEIERVQENYNTLLDQVTRLTDRNRDVEQVIGEKREYIARLQERLSNRNDALEAAKKFVTVRQSGAVASAVNTAYDLLRLELTKREG